MPLGVWNGIYVKNAGGTAYQFFQPFRSSGGTRPSWVARGVLAWIGVER